ncbi:hypothetical protein [Streptomyces sp. NPDC002187]|uniref:hypothetical protein n=1 Tax=Streptomyces sp. NPDC002187 TaxID=3364637 RepID=UPI0036AB4ED4
MWQEAPIYDRLVTELGDIPAQVRTEAERTVRALEEAIRPSTPWQADSRTQYGRSPRPSSPLL